MRRQMVVVPFSEVGHTGLSGRAYELCCDAQCEMFAGILVVKVDLKNVPYPSTPDSLQCSDSQTDRETFEGWEDVPFSRYST